MKFLVQVNALRQAAAGNPILSPKRAGCCSRRGGGLQGRGHPQCDRERRSTRCRVRRPLAGEAKSGRSSVGHRAVGAGDGLAEVGVPGQPCGGVIAVVADSIDVLGGSAGVDFEGNLPVLRISCDDGGASVLPDAVEKSIGMSATNAPNSSRNNRRRAWTRAEKAISGQATP